LNSGNDLKKLHLKNSNTSFYKYRQSEYFFLVKQSSFLHT